MARRFFFFCFFFLSKEILQAMNCSNITICSLRMSYKLRQNSVKRNEFLQDSGPASEAETSVSGKTKCLLATSEDKKASL